MSVSLKSLNEQVIIVTRASSGIGLATAEATARQGMHSASKQAVKGFADALRVEMEQVDMASISITPIQPAAVNTPFPQHAKNHMKAEPKLSTSQIDPRQVADAILNAATHAKRDVKAGMMATLNTKTQALFPALAHRIAAKQANRQQYDETPHDPEGTLYKPGGSGYIHGSGGITHH